MPARTLLAALLTLVSAAFIAPAANAATTVVADPAAQDVTALDGTVVWVSGDIGAQTLMQHDAAGDRPVMGAPRAQSYRSIDLGRDRNNRLVLTYARCSGPGAPSRRASTWTRPSA